MVLNMREMKDTYIPGIEYVPNDWSKAPLRALFKFGKGLSITKADLTDNGAPVISYGQIHAKYNTGTSTIESLIRYVPEEISNKSEKSRAQVGGFIFADTSEDLDGCGNCAYIDKDGIFAGYHTILLTPIQQTENRFLAYLFKTDAWRFQFKRNLTEVKLYSISQKELKHSWVIIPSTSEQDTIVNYLDRHCSAIDRTIKATQDSIEKLKEYKIALITRAVTKGLNPDAEMKASDNSCIGDIPKHWYCCKILYILAMRITDGPHETPKPVSTGIPFVSAEAVSQGNGTINFDYIWGYISKEFYEECCKKYIPQIDDVYMIKSGATTGKVAIVDTDRVFTIWSPLAVLRTNNSKMIAKFLYYYLQSKSYQQQVELGWNYGTQQNIGMRTIEKLLICVPPKEEQQAIISYIDTRCSAIDHLITKKEHLIEKFTEYRQSLIYHAVTGKIDCREDENYV